MAKKKIIRKSNRPFTYNPHYYTWGGDFKKALGDLGPFDLKGTFSGANVANMLKGGVASGLGSAVGKIGGGLIGGGLKSGAGNAISNIGGAVGGAVGKVNPVLGGVISAGSGIMGGAVNAVIGSKLNQEKINEIEGSNREMNTLVVDNSSTDSVMNQWANQNFGEGFSQSDIGKDGLFSNKAKNTYKKLKRQQDAARNRALASYENAANIADKNTDLNAAANFAAYGGPLDLWGIGGGAIGYELAKEDLGIKAMNALTKNKITSLPNSFTDTNTFASGGKIHIKPSKRGTFTAAAKKHGKSVLAFASQVLANKENYSPAMRKKAQFAKNSASWRHDEGGPLFNYNDLKKDDYGLLTYNGTPILPYEYSSRRTPEDKSTRRDTPLGYLVGDENLNTANLIWGGMELLPVVGNVMGIFDVANDVYNMANSDNISSGNFGNLLLDIGGLVPGISTFTKASKLAKAAKLRKAASKLDNAAESLRYTSPEGVKEVKQRVKDARSFSLRASEEATNAALSRNKEDLYKASMRAREAAKFNEGILNGIERTLDPFWSKYNVYLNVGTKSDALNDIFGFMGSVEDNVKAFGGELTHGGIFNNGTTIIGNGGTHEENPYEGVQMGVDNQGIPNLVEEGEVVFNDYVFSNRLTVPDAVREKYKLRGNKELTFADAAKQMQKESEERPNDPISKRGLESAMLRLQQAQETVRQQNQVGQEGVQYAHGGRMGTLFDGTGDKPNIMARAKAKRLGYDVGNSLEDYFEDPVYENGDTNKGFDLTSLRYAPALGNFLGLSQNLLSKPDYTSSDTALEAANQAGNYTPVDYTPNGNYLQYNPFDTNYYLTKLSAQAGATRRAIMNTTSPSRNAALLAADYNALGRLGDLARQAEEYNLAQRQAVETFNRGTNQANAEMGLKAAMANQEAALKAKSQRLSGVAQAMAMRDAVDARRGASMSANLTNLFESLGNIGIDEMNRADRDFYIKHVMGANLPLEEYRRLYGLDAAKKEAKKRGFTDNEITKLFLKNGGKLKKRRGGLTY